jgi:two-component system response regulator RegX3
VSTSTIARVLVVEDEASIRQGLCDVLTFRGYRVEAVGDGRAALAEVARQSFDLILLDVMLPELDGFSVCAAIRAERREVPIVMLTAKGSEEDILRGFEVGADDYVTKPFSVRQFLARVQALLKRSGRLATDNFRVGAFEVQPAHGRASLGTPAKAAEAIELSEKEIRILRLLSEEPGRIVSRRTLLREVWGMNNVENVETRTVDMHIAKLRKKLGDDAATLIETVRGQGYRVCGSPH